MHRGNPCEPQPPTGTGSHTHSRPKPRPARGKPATAAASHSHSRSSWSLCAPTGVKMRAHRTASDSLDAEFWPQARPATQNDSQIGTKDSQMGPRRRPRPPQGPHWTTKVSQNGSQKGARRTSQRDQAEASLAWSRWPCLGVLLGCSFGVLFQITSGT